MVTSQGQTTTAPQKVGALGPGLEEEVQPSVCIHILLKFHHKAHV